MRPAGLKAFEARLEEKSGIGAPSKGTPRSLAMLMRSSFVPAKAWEFFQAQPAWYRSDGHVVGDQREERRDQAQGGSPPLIEDSEHERTINSLTRPSSQV